MGIQNENIKVVEFLWVEEASSSSFSYISHPSSLPFMFLVLLENNFKKIHHH